MRKFKVVRVWPGGKGIGHTLVDHAGEIRWEENDMGEKFLESELEGYAEEIPAEAWFVNRLGNVESSLDYGPIAKHLLFRTKESAEKFSKALKESHGITLDGADLTKAIMGALNDRVK